MYHTLKKYFGYDTFHPMQEDIIRHVLNGGSALVLMPTGGGKSLCYQLPAVLLPGITVVVSPLISLMKDQVEQLTAAGIPAAALNSTLNEAEDYRLRTACHAGKLKLLYISPERLLMELDYLINDIDVSLFAIDEAHCISQWGHDFREEYSQLNVLHERYPNTPIIALTATADRVTRQDIVRQLFSQEYVSSVSQTTFAYQPASQQPEHSASSPQFRIFIASFDRPNISLAVKRNSNSNARRNAILSLIQRHSGESGIVYCLSRKIAEQMSFFLRNHDITSAVYHAGLSTSERNQAQEDFINDRVQVICATIAFGMGINKSNVRWIVHNNLPKSIESFYQEVGRAGRDGLPAETVLFYNYGDIVMLEKFAKESGQRDINMERLRCMRKYAESTVCRRRILLNYFGEPDNKDCCNCDICNNPPQRFDGSRLVQMALSAVVRTEQRLSLSGCIEVLRGINSNVVRRNGWETLPTFGVGRDTNGPDWQDYIMQMIHLGYIEVAYDDHSHLRITPMGNEVLYGRQQAQLSIPVRDEPKPKKDTTIGRYPETLHQTASARPDPALMQLLRTLRKQLADQQGIPAYVIMSDKTLENIVLARPTTIEAFGRISGIGEYKRQKYGPAFIEAISDYLS